MPENTDPIAQLEALLDRIDPDTPRVVVRWVDETRIVPEGESGFTVGPVMYATFTLRIDGEVGQHRIDDISLQPHETSHVCRISVIMVRRIQMIDDLMSEHFALQLTKLHSRAVAK